MIAFLPQNMPAWAATPAVKAQVRAQYMVLLRGYRDYLEQIPCGAAASWKRGVWA